MADTERREVGRKRTLLNGILVYGSTGLTADCGVRNVFDAGAEVKLASPALLQAPAGLLIPSVGRAWEALVTWQRGPQVGLHFRREIDLGNATIQEPDRTLHRIWRIRS